MLATRVRLLCALCALLAPSAPARAEEDGAALQSPDTPAVMRSVGGKPTSLHRYDYGTVAQHAELTATIPYHNGGAQALSNLRVKSGCSCFLNRGRTFARAWRPGLP